MGIKHTYYMFHKPAGYITAKTDPRHATVMEFFTDCHNEKLHPVGRLDIDTEGLLLMTDDGHFNQHLMHPQSHVEKTYFFWAMGILDEEKIRQLEQGVEMIGKEGLTAPAKVTKLETAVLSDILQYVQGNKYKKARRNRPDKEVVSGMITITEGKKHQVKRMLKAVGCCIVYLKRISIGKLKLDETLPKGAYRELTEAELLLLQ